MTRSSVAVVVTCFNLGRTLDEAIVSVQTQTLAADEIVVVDDGSTDLFTRQVLAHHEKRGLRILRTTNQGVSAARNTGIRATTAPLVVLLDADDILDPRYLETASTLLDGDAGLSFVSCGMRSFGATEEVWYPRSPELIASLTHGVPHISSMFRRAMWDAVGGFDQSMRAHEEVDFWTSVNERGFRGVVIQEPLLRYRVRPGSMYQSAVRREQHLALMDRFYQKHEAALTPHVEALVIEKERFIVDQKQHQEQLGQRKEELVRELESLQRQINETTVALESFGLSRVDLGDLKQLAPISPVWGQDRGIPLDRYYINRFVSQHRSDIRGRVLEVKDNSYTTAFGDDRVTKSDILDIDATNLRANIVADLTRADTIPSDTYDCFVLTQTLGLIYDVESALKHAFRILKPGGALLCTMPAVGRVTYEEGLDGDFWRFTEASIRLLFAEHYPEDAFVVEGHGNVLAATAFLYGLAPHELTSAELDTVDPFFPVVYTVRAVKPVTGAAQASMEKGSMGQGVIVSPTSPTPGAVLMYHRIDDAEMDEHHLAVPSEEFRAHMRLLHDHGVQVLPLDELVERAAAGRLAGPTVSITFDDGYLNSLTCAAPMLSAWNFPATFFIVSAALDPGFEFWWDVLERVFFSGLVLPPTMNLAPPAFPFCFETARPEEQREAHDQIKERFYLLDQSSRTATLNALKAWSGLTTGRNETHRAMHADEVQRLARLPGMSIGAHTVHHLSLPGLSLEGKLQEVFRSKSRIESVCGRPVRTFSYPYGAQDEETVRVVREAGFDIAVTTEESRLRYPADQLLVPRFEIRKGGIAAFDTRLEQIFG